MMKITKFAALALTFLALAPFTAQAATDVINNQDALFAIPASNNHVPDVNRKWSKPKICRVSKSYTCVVCSTKGGILTSIEVSSGVVGGFAVALDTGAIPSSREPAASGAGALLTRQRTCEFTVATTGLATGACGRSFFDEGRPFDNGMTLCATGATSANDVDVVATFREQTSTR